MRRLTIAGLVAAFLLTGTNAIQATEQTSPIGKPAPAISLADGTGKLISLPESSVAPYVVVAFLGTECPLVVNLYGSRLERIAKEFRDRGVHVVGIVSNVQDSAEEIQAFAKKQGITFPLLRDADAKIADAFGAKRTPEVYLLDPARVIRYHGRIDDQGQVGFIRTEPQRHDLTDAINDLLAGKAVREPELPAFGCLIGRKREPASSSPITYASHVASIFQKRCLECHRDGEIGPFSMERFDEVSGWAEMIKEVVEQERMPPWFANPKHGTFANDARMTEEEKKTIADWVAAGAPLGNVADLPKPKEYTDGWNIGTPDVVFPMADKPFQVPAEGVIDYKHFVVDPNFTEDKWLTACEVRPGNRAVVHHVLVFCREPGKRTMLDIFNGGLIAAYAPGMPAYQAPAGAARRFPAGSKIVIQMHYTVNGRPQEDLTSVGFKFTEKKEIKQELEALAANNFFISIPPNADNHQIKSVYHFRQDKLLVNLTPHMHMRGKSFRFEAQYADNSREILLDVPRFDFNWQLQYNLATPKFMPRGSTLVCTAYYDNSTKNPANPDPNRTVHFGEQSWDEMMIGWFTAISPPKGETATKPVGTSVSER